MGWNKIQTQLPGLLEVSAKVVGRCQMGQEMGGARNKGDGAICGVTRPLTPPCRAAARHLMGLVLK